MGDLLKLSRHLWVMVQKVFRHSDLLNTEETETKIIENSVNPGGAGPKAFSWINKKAADHH